MASFAVARKVGIGVVARGWSQVSALILAIVAARVLGRAEFGVYAIASAFVVLLQALMYGGIYDYIVKDKADDGILGTCFWMNLVFGIGGACVVAALAFGLGALTHTPQVTHLMLWLAPSAVVASVTSWQEAVLLRDGRLKAYYILWIVTEIFAGTLAVVLFYESFGLYALVVYRYAQLTLASLGYFVLLRRVPRIEWRQDVARAAFSFAINIYVSRIVGTIANYSGDILIGTLVNPAAAGAYRLGSRVVLGVSEIVYQPIATMAWVHFSRAQDRPEALRTEWFTLLAALTLTAWPALAGLAYISHSALLLIVGPGWDEAVPVIGILAFARVLAAFEVFLEPTLGVLNRSAMILKIRATASFAAVAILCVLARYGAVGAAAAQMIVACGIAVTALVIGLRATRTGATAILRQLIPGLLCTGATLCGAATALALDPAQRPPAATLALAMAGGGLFWALTLFLCFRSTRGPDVLRNARSAL